MQKKKEKKEDKTVGEAVLEDTLKAIQTKFGEGSIMKLGYSISLASNAQTSRAKSSGV